MFFRRWERTDFLEKVQCRVEMAYFSKCVCVCDFSPLRSPGCHRPGSGPPDPWHLERETVLSTCDHRGWSHCSTFREHFCHCWKTKGLGHIQAVVNYSVTWELNAFPTNSYETRPPPLRAPTGSSTRSLLPLQDLWLVNVGQREGVRPCKAWPGLQRPFLFPKPSF